MKLPFQNTTAEWRILHLAGMSALGNALLGLGKVASGVLAGSFFVCVNGLYTLALVLARACALAGSAQGTPRAAQFRCCRWSGRLLVLASALYVAYSGWSWYHPKAVDCHPYAAIGIAAVTFTEIGLNLHGVWRYRRDDRPLLHALKTINLAASFISLVLTQSVLLSFTGEHDPAYNALLGGLMGVCAALLGAYMIRRIQRMQHAEKGENQ